MMMRLDRTLNFVKHGWMQGALGIVGQFILRRIGIRVNNCTKQDYASRRRAPAARTAKRRWPRSAKDLTTSKRGGQSPPGRR